MSDLTWLNIYTDTRMTNNNEHAHGLVSLLYSVSLPEHLSGTLKVFPYLIQIPPMEMGMRVCVCVRDVLNLTWYMRVVLLERSSIRHSPRSGDQSTALLLSSKKRPKHTACLLIQSQNRSLPPLITAAVIPSTLITFLAFLAIYFSTSLTSEKNVDKRDWYDRKSVHYQVI